MNLTAKAEVHDFWNAQSCGEALFLHGLSKKDYMSQLENRYRVEPYILSFANFEFYREKKVLEIGVGLGADHQMFAQAGANLFGIDLTMRAVEHTLNRLRLFELNSTINIGDAENLTFSKEEFDLVYSWGVLHHSPDTAQAIMEVYRVLKVGGEAKIMIYYKYSLVGLMLWVRYALFRFRPWTSLNSIYNQYLESPGTKAFSISEAKQLFSNFKEVNFQICLSPGDILLDHVGQRHGGLSLTILRKLYPRRIIQKFFSKFGLFLLISAKK